MGRTVVFSVVVVVADIVVDVCTYWGVGLSFGYLFLKYMYMFYSKIMQRISIIMTI